MPRGIDDLLPTFSDIEVAFLLFVAFDTDGLSAARSHINCHAVLCKLILKLKGGLPYYLSGRREDVVVELVVFNGLTSCLSLPHVLGNILGSVLGRGGEEEEDHQECSS